MPLAWLLLQVALNPSSVGEFRLDSFRWALLGRTLFYNGLAGLVATLLALPAALVLGRGRGAAAAILWFLMPASLLLPSLTYAYGWSQCLRLCGVRLELAGAGDVARCIWSLATWLWALPAGIIGLALRRVDVSLQQQALLDGALWRVTLRQLAGPIVASVACVTILAAQEFAVYEPTGISVVATEVRMVFETGAVSSRSNPITAPISPGAADSNFASPHPDQRARAAAAVATSAPLLLAVALLGAVAAWAVRGLSASEDLDVGPWPRSLAAAVWATGLAAMALAVTAGVPVASLLLSLKAPMDPILFWQQFEPQMTGSLLVGGITAAVAFGLTLAASARRTKRLLPLALLTFLIGGQLLAIALIRLYNHPSPWLVAGQDRFGPLRAWLPDPFSLVYNGVPIVVMAYLGRFGWLCLSAAGMTWSTPWRQVRSMAALDGADAMQTAAHVVWPLAWPIFAAGALVIGILSLSEVPATVLLCPARPPMFTPMLMTWVHKLRDDPMIEGSLLMMSVVLVLSAAATGLAWLGRGVRRAALRRAALPLILFLALPALGPGCRDTRQPLAVWCQTGTGPDEVVYPRAIAYAPADDSFFIIDRLARVQHLDRDGKYLSEWRMPEWRYGKPVGVAVGPDGNIYIPDTHYHRVVVYSPQGKMLRQWGSEGTAPGQFIYPTDLAFDSQGHIFVSEYGDNDRIQVFDPASGRVLYQFGKFGNGSGEFSRPQTMVMDHDTLYVTDACNHRIAVFTAAGKFLRNMGSAGSGLGQYRFPYGMGEDREGHLIVCEFGNNRVQMIDKETGRGLKIWGAGGREPGQFAYPWGVAVDKRDRVVAVDSGNNRLQVFEF